MFYACPCLSAPPLRGVHWRRKLPLLTHIFCYFQPPDRTVHRTEKTKRNRRTNQQPAHHVIIIYIQYFILNTNEFTIFELKTDLPTIHIRQKHTNLTHYTNTNDSFYSMRYSRFYHSYVAGIHTGT